MKRIKVQRDDPPIPPTLDPPLVDIDFKSKFKIGVTEVMEFIHTPDTTHLRSANLHRVRLRLKHTIISKNFKIDLKHRVKVMTNIDTLH